jgi:Domain of unknown function (DUF5623)
VIHPKARMSLEDHRDIGSRIKALLGSVRLTKRLERVRCTLDSWLSLEYDEYEVGVERGWTSIYYGRNWSPKRAAQEDLEDIGRIQEILRRAYPSCACLSKMLDDLAHVARKAVADSESTDWYSTVLFDTVMKVMKIPMDKRESLQRYLSGWSPLHLKRIIHHPERFSYLPKLVDEIYTEQQSLSTRSNPRRGLLGEGSDRAAAGSQV